MDLTKVCRTCLIDHGEMQSIFSDASATTNRVEAVDCDDDKYELTINKNNKLTSIPKMIKICTRTTVSQLDGLPDQMCLACIDNVTGFYEFKQKCEFSYEKLLNITGKTNLLNVNDKSIQTDLTITYFACEMCEEKFTTEENRRVHRLIHKEEGFKCRLCPGSYSRLNQLQRHQEKKHPEIVSTNYYQNNIEKNVCDICDKGFVRRDHLKRHILLVHGEKSIVGENNDEVDKKDPEIVDKSRNSVDISDNKENVKEEIENFNDYNCDSVDGDGVGDGAIDDALSDEDDTFLISKDIDNDKSTKDSIEVVTIKRSRGRPKKINVKNSPIVEAARIPSEKKSKLKKNHLINGKQHVCDVCNRCFARSTHLKRHLTIHSDVKPFECNLCEKKFRRLDHLNNHKMHHNLVKEFICDICNRGFHRADNIRKHMETRHSNKPRLQSQKTDFCKICNRGFSTAKYLKSHMRIHSEDNIFACKMCDETFLSKSTLNEHLKIHVNARPFLCSECGLSFVRNDYLVVHMRRHKGEKPYKCKYCSKGFPRATDLTVHERYHTGEKTHLCTTCGKGFQRAYNLVVHMRVHTGERPYQCPHCTKSFAQGNDLKAHIRRHTGERYKCEFCGDGFIQGYHLTQHKRNVHGIDVKSSIRRVEKFVTPSVIVIGGADGTLDNKQQIQVPLLQPQQPQQQLQQQDIFSSLSVDHVKLEPSPIINYNNEEMLLNDGSQSPCGIKSSNHHNQQTEMVLHRDVSSNHSNGGNSYHLTDEHYDNNCENVNNVNNILILPSS